MKKEMIIIRGPLGVGKSTISKRLAQEIGGKYFSVDEILDDKGLAVVDEKLGCISEASFIRVNDLIVGEVKEWLGKDVPVVVDGNFYHRGQLDNLVERVDGKASVFTLVAPLEVCIERDLQRETPHGEGAAMAVYNLVSALDVGEKIDVEKSSIEETVIRLRKDYLNSFTM